ncbi:ABC transporter permease [Paenibacillus rigui]|uniref:ABC transporter permease n=1 Tax=Paenibacillus rigui TaxID=554312 RepID=A0A229UK91_9BACL|nr:ABC-2 family transporter protein [Paenibacillus rigui]OXM83867.1 ABC transporter permease [Paenibacillus rigui]
MPSKYVKSFSLGVQKVLEYRTNFFLSLFNCIFPILIQFFFWKAVFASSNRSEVFGYSYNQLIAYSILAILMNKLIGTSFQFEIARDIKDGGLNKYLIKPIGYFAYRICCFLGEKSIEMLAILTLSMVVVWVLHLWLGFTVAGGQVLLFLCVVPLALLLNFFIYYSLSAIAFWFIESNGAFRTFGLLATIASGGLFPLDVYSSGMQKILLLLPFNYVVYFPIQLLSGKLSVEQIGQGLVMQIIWIGVFAILSGMMWNTGMKKYVAVGG